MKNKYYIIVYDDFFDKEFDCIIEANSKEEAIDIAKDEYAYELDTTIDEIVIKHIEVIES